MDCSFSREDTKAIKGVAVTLMLMHHLWGFPKRILGGELTYFITVFGQSSISYLGAFGKLCVSLFFFLGGYGMYKLAQQKRLDITLHIKKLYISYWKVFLIFIPIAFLFFSNQPIYCESEEICTRFSEFSFQSLFSNFLGFSDSYNSEWWFFRSYIVAILTFPMVRKVINKFSFSLNIFIIIVLTIGVSTVFPALGNLEILGQLKNNYLYTTIFCQSAPFIASFWSGALMSKDNSLEALAQSLSAHHMFSPLHNIFFLGVIVFARTTAIGSQLDFLYAPLFIICCTNLLHLFHPLRTVFLMLGKQSTNMWLIHSFYCYYFYQIAKIVVAPRYAILSLIILIVMSYISSVLLSAFWDLVQKIYVSLMKTKIRIERRFLYDTRH